MRILSLVVIICLVTTACSAGLVGTDNAAQTVYDPDWDNGDNGSASGAGFGAWTLTKNGNSGHFIGNSTNLAGGAGANINTSSKSFGMYAEADGGTAGVDFADASRSLNSSLSVGQTFSIDLAVNFRNGNKGIDVLSSGGNIFNLNIGSDNYAISNAATGNGNIMNNGYDQNTAFALEFSQTSLSGGTWSVTRSGGTSSLNTGTYSGVVNAFKLYVSDTDGGSPNDLFANNLAVVPEPSGFACLAFLACCCLGAQTLATFVFWPYEGEPNLPLHAALDKKSGLGPRHLAEPLLRLPTAHQKQHEPNGEATADFGHGG